MCFVLSVEIERKDFVKVMKKRIVKTRRKQFRCGLGLQLALSLFTVRP
jgi:hypothetical protein